MPAEAGIVEIDQAQAWAFDQQVFRDQVGVNHAEVAQAAAVFAQVHACLAAGVQEQFTLFIAQASQLPEASPERVGADQAVLVPGMANEFVGLLPLR
ncbi:hypothetical protein D3C71_2038360 [compost metagenome]